MQLSQEVRIGPGQYICEEGALGYLSDKLQQFDRPYIIGGKKSLEAFDKHLPVTLDISKLLYDGTASNEDMSRLAELAKDADVIIGVGGGKALDTAKGTADLLNVETIMIPTVMGTCAACTPLSAVYYPDHLFKAVDYYNRSAYLVLLDLNLLVESPKNYFIGGIGDTLAKWYEAEGITRNYVSNTFSVMVDMGLSAAKLTQEVLLKDAEKALQSMDEKKVTPEFTRVVEAVITVAAMVGGCAGEYGRMAGAHAIHNGLSYFPETHEVLHGVKVSYGILVQLMATGDEIEVKRLLQFYKKNGFPYNLAALNISESANSAAIRLAEYASKKDETFVLAKKDVTSDEIVKAILELEALEN